MGLSLKFGLRLNTKGQIMTEKWAIVTGASGGIGLDMAKILAERSYHLVLVARNRGKLEEAQKLLATPTRQVKIVVADLSKTESVEGLVQQTDKWGIVPEVLINNAGIGAHGPFLDGTAEEAHGMLNLNIDALVMLSYHYGRKMRERQLGYILQVSSTAAYQPLPNYAVYAASKSMVLAFSRAFNYEALPFGVSSTALCPGPTATSFFTNAHHKINRSFSAIMMSPEDVARQGIDAMFERQETHVAGFVNKVTAAIPRLVPSKLIVRSAAIFMK